MTEVLTDGPNGNKYLSVRERTMGHHGPRVSLDIDCIVPNEPYLLSLRYRLKSTIGANTLRTPYVKMIRKDVDNGRDPWISPTMARGSIADVQDGSWNVLQHTIYFPDDQADSSIVSELYLYLNVLDIDADIDWELLNAHLAENMNKLYLW